MVDHTLKENCESCPACELRREGLDLTRIDREAVPCNACGGTGLIPIPPDEIVRRAAEAARRDYWPMMEARWKKDAANKRRAAARRAKREAQRQRIAPVQGVFRVPGADDQNSVGHGGSFRGQGKGEGLGGHFDPPILINVLWWRH